MKELLQGRRFGYAPRPAFAHVAVGLAVATTVLDLAAWFQWGARDTNGFVVGAYWTAIATTVAAALAGLMAVAELLDAPDEERTLSRLDLVAAVVAALLSLASVVLRGADLAAAGVTPAVLLLTVAMLLVLVVDGAISANLYAAREWEELEEDVSLERHRRRRAAVR